MNSKRYENLGILKIKIQNGRLTILDFFEFRYDGVFRVAEYAENYRFEIFKILKHIELF